MRKGDWVYLPMAGGQKANKETPELFNIKKDMPQGVNVIESNAKKLAELKTLYQRYVDECKR